MRAWTPLVLSVLFAGATCIAADNSKPPSPSTPTGKAGAQPANPEGAVTDKPAGAGGSAAGLYIVKDGNRVDAKTLEGWRTWRALACERCHGAEQEGLVGPSLVESLKKLTKEEFHTTIMNGRPEKGMPPWSGSKMVTDNWEGLYAYLKGRSEGKIKPGHLYPLDKGK